MNEKKLMNRAADNIRILAASMVEKANSGHPGGAMGGADFVNVLFSEFLVYDPENPRWEGRDRFFLDPGHMSPMLYSTLALTGKFREQDGIEHILRTISKDHPFKFRINEETDSILEMRICVRSGRAHV